MGSLQPIHFRPQSVYLSRHRILLGILLVVSASVFLWYRLALPSVLRAGYNQYPPYLRAGKNGKPEGIPAEMLQHAANSAGIPLRWVRIPRSADEAFRNKEIDIYPLLTITEERQATLAISKPWWENEIALTSPEANKLATARDTDGKRIATRLGTVQAMAAKLFPKATIVPIAQIDDIVTAMCEGFTRAPGPAPAGATALPETSIAHRFHPGWQCFVGDGGSERQRARGGKNLSGDRQAGARWNAFGYCIRMGRLESL